MRLVFNMPYSANNGKGITTGRPTYLLSLCSFSTVLSNLTLKHSQGVDTNRRLYESGVCQTKQALVE